MATFFCNIWYKVLVICVVAIVVNSAALAQRPPIHVTIKVIGYDTAKTLYGDSVYVLQIKLHNFADTAVSFGHMSCSWYEDFNIASGEFGFCYWPCDKNFASKSTIPPKSEWTSQISVYKKNKHAKDIQVSLMYLNGDDYVRTWPTEIRLQSKDYLEANTHVLTSNVYTLDDTQILPYTKSE
jgi:hypothetical protein